MASRTVTLDEDVVQRLLDLVRGSKARLLRRHSSDPMLGSALERLERCRLQLRGDPDDIVCRSTDSVLGLNASQPTLRGNPS